MTLSGRPNRYLLTPLMLDQPAPALTRLARPGWDMIAPTIPFVGQSERLAVIHRTLAGRVTEAVKAGTLPVSIAGDCCTAIATLAGLQRGGVAPVLVWLDAHGDFNTADTTITGFVGGMPLAMITGRGDQGMVRGAGLRPIPDTDVFLCDARDLDPRERELLDASGVRRMADPKTIPAMLPHERPIYVHLDFDILDPSDAPAMEYSVPGGPSLRSLVVLGEALRASGRLAAVSVTTWDLATDHDLKTERSCFAVLHALTGRGWTA